MKHKQLLLAVCSFSSSWRIILEGRRVGSALPQTKHIIIPMQLARIAVKNDLGVQLHCEVWPINMIILLIRGMLRGLCTLVLFVSNCKRM